MYLFVVSKCYFNNIQQWAIHTLLLRIMKHGHAENALRVSEKCKRLLRYWWSWGNQLPDWKQTFWSALIHTWRSQFKAMNCPNLVQARARFGAKPPIHSRGHYPNPYCAYEDPYSGASSPRFSYGCLRSIRCIRFYARPTSANPYGSSSCLY